MIDVSDIEKQHEDARARILHHRARLGNRVRIPPRVQHRGRANLDALELLDRLRPAVLEHLELVLREVADRDAVRVGYASTRT